MANRSMHGMIRTPHTEPVFMAVEFAVDGASAITSGSQTCASFVTVSKPAGTGIYRFTFADTYQSVLYADATLLKAAGTLDADILPVAETNEASATPLVVDFQVKKTSDGTALDPTSLTIKAIFFLRNSQVSL